MLQCHTATATVDILYLNAIPIVTIAGSNIREVKRSDRISLRSSAFVGTCNSTNRYSGMTFDWQVSRDGVVNPLLSSKSRNPFKYLLPGNMLNVSETYIITVTVVDSVYGGAAYSTVSVAVIPSAVRAVISGGSHQMWRVGEADLTLDGSDSFDVDIGAGVVNQGLT